MQIKSRFEEYFRRRLVEFLFASFIIFGIGYLIYDTLIPYFYTPQDKKIYFENKAKIENPAWSKSHSYKEFVKAYEKVDKIESKYAIYRALPFVNLRAFFVALISFFVPAFVFISFSYFWLKKKSFFFFQGAKKEQPLKLGKPIRLLLFKNLKKGILNLTEKEFVDIVFNGDFKSYAKVMAFMNGEIIETDRIKFPLKKVNKTIEDLTNQMVKWGYATLKLGKEDEKLFRACLYLSLFHHIANLYGNIPVSFLSPYVKNSVVNDFKSFYYYKKLPTKLGKVRDFLTIFHTFPIDVLDFLKKEFTPLSFEKYDDLYFREEFFKNALSDYKEAEKLKEEMEKEEKKKVIKKSKKRESTGFFKALFKRG